MPKQASILQQHGFIHGGIVTTLADTAGGLSTFSTLQDPAESCITVELKINFMRPANTDLRAVGRVLSEGKTLLVSSAELFTT